MLKYIQKRQEIDRTIDPVLVHGHYLMGILLVHASSTSYQKNFTTLSINLNLLGTAFEDSAQERKEASY